MTTEAQKKATAKYKKDHNVQIYLAINKDTEADILERLNSVPYKMTYIKDLIRKDIQENPDLYGTIATTHTITHTITQATTL